MSTAFNHNMCYLSIYHFFLPPWPNFMALLTVSKESVLAEAGYSVLMSSVFHRSFGISVGVRAHSTIQGTLALPFPNILPFVLLNFLLCNATFFICKIRSHLFSVYSPGMHPRYINQRILLFMQILRRARAPRRHFLLGKGHLMKKL